VISKGGSYPTFPRRGRSFLILDWPGAVDTSLSRRFLFSNATSRAAQLIHSSLSGTSLASQHCARFRARPEDVRRAQGVGELCHRGIAGGVHQVNCRGFRDARVPLVVVGKPAKPALKKKWCGWPDSNRQRGKPQRILSPPRMPISPQPHRTATRLKKHITGLQSNWNQIPLEAIHTRDEIRATEYSRLGCLRMVGYEIL
jgi:hypothetical protein